MTTVFLTKSSTSPYTFPANADLNHSVLDNTYNPTALLVASGTPTSVGVGQTITPNQTTSITELMIWIGPAVGSPADNLYFIIEQNALGSGIIVARSFTYPIGNLTQNAWNLITLSQEVVLVGGRTYAISSNRTGATSTVNYFQIGSSNTSNLSQVLWGPTNSGYIFNGSTWVAQSWDLAFALIHRHEVQLLGNGGNGGSGTTALSGAGGGGGGYGQYFYISGIIPGVTTVPFAVAAGGSNNNFGAVWQQTSLSALTNAQGAGGGKNGSGITAGAAGTLGTVSGTPPISYLYWYGIAGGIGGAGRNAASSGGGGGGGAGGWGAAGGAGGTPTSTNGCGGGGGMTGTAAAGGASVAGGAGYTGTAGSTTGQNGTGSSGGAGSNSVSTATLTQGGNGGSGLEFDGYGLSTGTSGPGGGGGGSGANTGAVTANNKGGAGGQFGGGGGGFGSFAGTIGTSAVGVGGDALIVLNFFPLPIVSDVAGWAENEWRV
jgi:hypothetical protein